MKLIGIGDDVYEILETGSIPVVGDAILFRIDPETWLSGVVTGVTEEGCWLMDNQQREHFRFYEGKEFIILRLQ